MKCLIEEKELHFGSSNGVDYSYINEGSGDNLILIPGTLGNYQIYCKIIPILAKSFNVYVFNHLNLKTIPEIINTYHQIFTDIVGSKFNLLGTSVGGYIVQYYAEKYPKSIRTLIIANSYHDNSVLRKKNLWTYRISKFLPFSMLRNIMVKNFTKSATTENYSIMKEYCENEVTSISKKYLRYRFNWTLSKKSVPDLPKAMRKIIIKTADDPVIPKITSQILVSKYSEAKVITLDHGGHFPYLFNPVKYAETVVNSIIQTNIS